MIQGVLKGKDYWTGPRRLAAVASTGRGSGRLPGGYVADLADLKKALILCSYCVPKFNAARAGYVTRANLPLVTGKCDGCNNFGSDQHFLIHHSLVNI